MLGALFALMTTTAVPADGPEPGIAHALAAERARRVGDLSVELRFRVPEACRETEGEALLSFELSEPGPLVLDFDGSALLALEVDGQPVEAERVHDHLVLPAAVATPGRHRIFARFRSAVAPTGTPLTVYHDASDGRDYFYTLCVPADAHRLFPCFDQPDLKARFTLELEVPRSFSVTANGEWRSVSAADGDFLRHHFATTAPISTYLFAFACGPYAVHEAPSPPAGVQGIHRPMRVFLRPSEVVHTDLAGLFALHARSLAWLEDYFGHPYPFGKLDFVLAPGFPYGGMEHPGSIFYRESALSFDHEPTLSELHRRSTLVYHEVSHQWFGNLVTMRWFDDLWLKEGFATFAGYRSLEALEPERSAWLRFQQQVKPAAYRVDATAGTTPVYQELGNLADAKSNYGAIVYNKAPAVLRELESRLGFAGFRSGVRLFLRRHAFGNATWQELIAAMEEATGADLAAWSSRWIQTAGMPRVRCRTTLDGNGRIAEFRVEQSDRTGEGRTWPLNLEVYLRFADGADRTIPLTLVGPSAVLPKLTGELPPRFVLLDPRDFEYGQFLLDPQSAQALLEDLPRESDPLLRAVAFQALFESVREGELDPDRFLQGALPVLRSERDPLSHAPVLAAISTTIGRYLPEERAAPRRAELAAILLAELESGELRGQELSLWSSYCSLSRLPDVQDVIRAVLDGNRRFPGLALGARDRFATVTALLAVGAPDGEARLDALAASLEGDYARELYVARAALPKAETKEHYFATWSNPDEPPEQWIQSSLGNFHSAGQEALTLPYLRPALEQIEWVKEHRKIFFMPAWIDAFVNGHESAEALAIVQSFLAERSDLSPDLRLKVLQSLDGLERAVRIRERFGAGK